MYVPFFLSDQQFLEDMLEDCQFFVQYPEVSCVFI